MDLRTKAVEITSQNHNYMLDEDSLDSEAVEVAHRSLNDQTVEGLEVKQHPAFSIQYHPEAAPGPHDACAAFRRFKKIIASH